MGSIFKPKMPALPPVQPPPEPPEPELSDEEKAKIKKEGWGFGANIDPQLIQLLDK